MTTKKLKLQFETEILKDKYCIGRVLDRTNFDVNTVCTSMQFKLVAHYNDILVSVGIEAHSEEPTQDLIVPMFWMQNQQGTQVQTPCTKLTGTWGWW